VHFLTQLILAQKSIKIKHQKLQFISLNPIGLSKR